jgi:hypothetical protein
MENFEKSRKLQQACELLGPVYGWFTEDFNTLDLKEAKAWLHELAWVGFCHADSAFRSISSVTSRSDFPYCARYRRAEARRNQPIDFPSKISTGEPTSDARRIADEQATCRR